jgi:hypothetical protein
MLGKNNRIAWSTSLGRVRIAIGEDVATGENIVRIILFAAIMRKDPKMSWRSKI